MIGEEGLPLDHVWAGVGFHLYRGFGPVLWALVDPAILSLLAPSSTGFSFPTLTFPIVNPLSNTLLEIGAIGY